MNKKYLKKTKAIYVSAVIGLLGWLLYRWTFYEEGFFWGLIAWIGLAVITLPGFYVIDYLLEHSPFDKKYHQQYSLLLISFYSCILGFSLWKSDYARFDYFDGENDFVLLVSLVLMGLGAFGVLVCMIQFLDKKFSKQETAEQYSPIDEARPNLVRRGEFGWFALDQGHIESFWLQEAELISTGSKVHGTLSQDTINRLKSMNEKFKDSFSITENYAYALENGLLEGHRISDNLGGGFMVVYPSGLVSFSVLANVR